MRGDMLPCPKCGAGPFNVGAPFRIGYGDKKYMIECYECKSKTQWGTWEEVYETWTGEKCSPNPKTTDKAQA